MYAALNAAGTNPAASDLLNSSAQNGAKTSTVSFTNRVAIGLLGTLAVLDF